MGHNGDRGHFSHLGGFGSGGHYPQHGAYPSQGFGQHSGGYSQSEYQQYGGHQSHGGGYSPHGYPSGSIYCIITHTLLYAILALTTTYSHARAWSWDHPGARLTCRSFLLSGPVEEGGPKGTDDREETPPPLTKEQIEGHVSALKSLIKSHNQRNKGDPIRLDFESEDTEAQDLGIAKGKEVMGEDLGKPFKEARRTPLTRRIIEFAGPEYKMPANNKLYDDTIDPEDHLSRFASAANSGEWPMPEPHEITKIVRKANDSLTTFKERWTVETGFIMGVLEVMKISSFMDTVKSPELAKHFSNKVPTTVNEMMERLDDFVRSEEAYARAELPKGEKGETHCKTNRRDAYLANRIRDDRASYPPLRGEYNHRVVPVLSLESLTKRPKEILATETQLHLPAPRPMLNPLRSGNTDRYCDYHQEKGHYTNDCIQLRKQLEMALESGKLNHLVKDVRHKGRGSHGREAPQPAKVINVISVNSVKDKKRKGREMTEPWMNIPISFLAISSEDVSEEPLIVEAEVEGYLVIRVYMDKGLSIEVMFEHCFKHSTKNKGRLRETNGLVGSPEKYQKH
ncbi:hypothetical protein Tco_1540834 [Tanacetum coccineum]